MGTATPPARWAAEYEMSQCSASSGRRWMPTRPPGSRPGLEEAAGHGVGRAVPLGEGQRPDVDHGEGGAVAELLGHAGQMIVHQHGDTAGFQVMAGDVTPSISARSSSLRNALLAIGTTGSGPQLPRSGRAGSLFRP